MVQNNGSEQSSIFYVFLFLINLLEKQYDFGFQKSLKNVKNNYVNYVF